MEVVNNLSLKIKVRKGDKFKVINNKGCKKIKIGDIVTATKDSNSSTIEVYSEERSCYERVVIDEHIIKLHKTEKDVLEAIDTHKRLIKNLENRLKYMRSNDLKELDEDKYKVWYMLETINKDTDNEEKLELIMELLNNGDC